VIADHLAPGDLFILRDTDFVRNLRLGKLLLSLADDRDFRNRVYAVRKRVLLESRRRLKHVRDRQPPLVHRCGRERWEANAVARRVNMRHFGLKELTYLEPAPRVGAQA